MTVPVTGLTDVLGIEYLVDGEPARNTRVKLERNAKTIEAALLRGGVAPKDYATTVQALAARLTALETPAPVAPFRLPLASWAQDFAGWQPLQLWCSRDTVFVAGMVSVKAGQVMPAGETAVATVPAAYRPKGAALMATAYIGGTTLVRADIEFGTGSIEIVNGGGFGAGTFIDIQAHWARAALPA